MSLFLLTFFLLYGGMHFYAYRKLAAAFSLPTPAAACVILFMTVMVCAPILVRLAEKSGLEPVAVSMAYAGYTWMGMLFLFSVSSAAIDVGFLLFALCGKMLGREVTTLLPSGRQVFLASCLASVSISVYGFFEALRIRPERLTIETRKLPPFVPRLTIVQISDVHLGLIVGRERLRKIAGIIEEARPDMLVSTGDLVNGQMDSLGNLAEMLQKINPRYGKFAVTGNHEYYAGFDHAMEFTRQSGFKLVHNGRIDVGGVLDVVGVDDPAAEMLGIRRVAEAELLGATSPGRFVLFLKHRPVASGETAGMFDLQLSGHVHKGQIFPFGLLTRLFYPVGTGYHRLGLNSSLYVSRGTGTWGPPIRFMAPPEVTIIELVNVGKE